MAPLLLASPLLAFLLFLLEVAFAIMVGRLIRDTLDIAWQAFEGTKRRHVVDFGARL